MTKFSKYLTNILLGGTALMLSSCFSQSPAEVVDKSQTYFGKNQPHQAAVNRTSQEQPASSTATDSNEIVMQSLEPLKPLPTQKKEQNPDQSTSGFLVSKTKTTKEVPTQNQHSIKSEPSHRVVEDNFKSAKSDMPNSEDLTFEEPEAQAKQEVTTPTKPDFASVSPLGMSQFEWPVVGGKVLSRFGKNGNKFNEGINISAPLGAPVTSAGDGKVIYIGNNIEGYGNMIIVKHSGDYMTAYSHVQEILVERGVQVKKGESIATIGKTGNVSSPQLHFSIRKGKKTINPEGSAAG